jgi:hypothetical protein
MVGDLARVAPIVRRRPGIRRPLRRTLGEYLDEWMAARRTSIGPSRWHNDTRYIEQHIRPRLGGAALT